MIKAKIQAIGSSELQGSPSMKENSAMNWSKHRWWEKFRVIYVERCNFSLWLMGIRLFSNGYKINFRNLILEDKLMKNL